MEARKGERQRRIKTVIGAEFLDTLSRRPVFPPPVRSCFPSLEYAAATCHIGICKEHLQICMSPMVSDRFLTSLSIADVVVKNLPSCTKIVANTGRLAVIHNYPDDHNSSLNLNQAHIGNAPKL